MNEFVHWSLGLAALAVSGRALWLMSRDRPVDDAQFYLLAVVEVALLVTAVATLVALGGTDRDIPAGLLVSYWVTTLTILPLGLLWGVSDKSRWGAGVVALAGFTVAALSVRLHQIWATGG